MKLRRYLNARKGRIRRSRNHRSRSEPRWMPFGDSPGRSIPPESAGNPSRAALYVADPERAEKLLAGIVEKRLLYWDSSVG